MTLQNLKSLKNEQPLTSDGSDLKDFGARPKVGRFEVEINKPASHSVTK
jgi:hypothetical protein